MAGIVRLTPGGEMPPDATPKCRPMRRRRKAAGSTRRARTPPDQKDGAKEETLQESSSNVSQEQTSATQGHTILRPIEWRLPQLQMPPGAAGKQRATLDAATSERAGKTKRNAGA